MKLSRAAQDAHGATLQNDNGALDAPRPDTPPAPPPPPPPAPMDTSEDADAANPAAELQLLNTTLAVLGEMA